MLRAPDAAILLRCEAGGESYCIEGAWVAAIERADRMEREPGDGGRIGWLTGRREAGGSGGVPVYSLAAVLGRPERPAEERAVGPILVLGGGSRWGLQVDRVARADVATGEPWMPLPEAVRAACGGRFTAALRLGDRLALVLAPDRLRPGGAAGPAAAETAAGGAEAGGSAETIGAGNEGEGEGEAEAAHGGAARAPFGVVPGPAAARSPDRRAGAVALFSADPDGRHGATLFGLSLTQVEEVLRGAPVTPVPGALDLLGLVVWRDRAVPVIDLGRRFDPRPADGTEPAERVDGAGAAVRLLVARAVRRREWIAFPVRADLRVEPLPLPSRAWADSPRISPLAALGVFELAAGTVVVPDVDRILTPDRASPEGGRAARSAAEERGESDEES